MIEQNLTSDDHANMLLTQRLDDTTNQWVEPLTTVRYHEIRQLVESESHTVGDLLRASLSSLIQGLEDAEQIDRLLARSVSLGAKTEQLRRDGISITCCTNSRYPDRLRQAMGSNAPPALYHVGDIQLLETVDIALSLPEIMDKDTGRYVQRVVQGLQRIGGTFASPAQNTAQLDIIRALAGANSSLALIMDQDLTSLASNRRFRKAIDNGVALLTTPNCPGAAFPNCPHTDAVSIISAIPRHVMRIDVGPPPGWSLEDPTPPQPQSPAAIDAPGATS